MSQAERIKTYLDVKKLKTQDTSQEEQQYSDMDESKPTFFSSQVGYFVTSFTNILDTTVCINILPNL